MTVKEPFEEDTVPPENPVFCKSIRYYFREYCNSSSIHGFRYFGEKRTYFERTWWFIVFSLVVASCAYFIKEVYHKWDTSPVIVSFDTSETPIYQIPFPAVTICPESKSMQSKYNHSDIYLKLLKANRKKSPVNITEEELKGAQYMSLVCDIYKNVNRTSLTFEGQDFFDFLDKVRRPKILFSCSWMGDNFKCEDLFVPIITDQGICYSFNMLDRDDIFRENVVQYKDFMKSPNTDKTNLTWNLDDGYGDDDAIDTYPLRAKYPGVKNALEVTMTADMDDLDPICKNSLHGFRAILHTPMRIPRPSNQYVRIPLDEAVLGAIQPVKISTSETVKVYDPVRRKCYFPQERYLQHFKIYTQLNCQMECLTNFTLQMCKCVNFFMPRENSTSICGVKRKTCLILAERMFQTSGLVSSIEDVKTQKHKLKNVTFSETEKSDCDCKPICSDLSYSLESSQAKWDWQDKYKMLYPKFISKNRMHMSKLILYFKTSQFVTSKRHELYGPTDFLANFGGLLGLFTGFSVLSIMELIYFLTIRLCCNVRLYGKWYGPER